MCKCLAPRTSAFALIFPKYTFYVPNPCILGTRPILPCKNGYCCKLEWQRACQVCLMVQSLFICRWLLTGGTVIPVAKFDSCCAYRSGEIHVLRISHGNTFVWWPRSALRRSIPSGTTFCPHYVRTTPAVFPHRFRSISAIFPHCFRGISALLR